MSSVARLGVFSALSSALAIVGAVSGALAGPPPVLHVDDDAPAGGDGLSWETAFNDLHDAIAKVNENRDDYHVVHIAGGVYKPDRGTGDRDASFTTGSAITVYMGGFAGLGAKDPDERDPRRFVSVLSGDLQGDDQPELANRADNSRSIIRVPDGSYAQFAGLTIRGGHADLPGSAGVGGAIRAMEYCAVVLQQCQVIDNFATNEGAAIYSHSTVAIYDSAIADNRTTLGGGAVATQGILFAVRSVFASNTGAGFGGAILADSGAEITDCLFTANEADNGGALYVSLGARIRGCAFHDNRSFFGGACVLTRGDYTLENSILWGNRAQQSGIQIALPDIPSSLAVSYCDIQGSYGGVHIGAPGTLRWGDGNVDQEPAWISPGGVDGLVETWADNDYSLSADSPCVDAGLLAIEDSFDTDLVGGLRRVSSRCDCLAQVDIGPIERQIRGCPANPPQVIYVNAAAKPGGDGFSWRTAFTNLNDALRTPGVQEVWIARGIYTPDDATRDRTRTFSLNCRIRLFGGFEGVETSRDERNPDKNPTVLSGDLLRNDTSDDATRADNARRVVEILAGSVTLSDIRITGGFTHTDTVREIARAAGIISVDSNLALNNCRVDDHRFRGLGHTYAAGMYVEGGDLRLDQTSITDNSSIGDFASVGGALLRADSLAVTRSTFSRNRSIGVQSAYSAGVEVNTRDASFADCVFENNQVDLTHNEVYAYAGALYSTLPGLSLFNCAFRNNSVTSARYASGGALTATGAGCVIANCVFDSNRAQARRDVWGGAANIYGGEPIISHCIFINNRAADNGVASQWGGAGLFASYSNLSLSNSILWNNRAAGASTQASQLGFDPDATIFASHCVLEGWDGSLPGVAVFSADPRFIDPLGPDTMPGTGDENLAPLAGSPCIDAGFTPLLPPDVTDLDRDGDVAEPLPLDLARRNRAFGISVDIGAYESQPCRADFNADGFNSSQDLFDYIIAFTEERSAADFNADGRVDSSDFFAFLSVFLAGC